MNQRVLLVITLQQGANIVYFLIDLDDSNAAVAEGQRHDRVNTLSYAFLREYFGTIMRSFKNDRTLIFNDCSELLDYVRQNDIQFVTEQVIRLPDEWAEEFYG
jgi:hypothetical protein